MRHLFACLFLILALPAGADPRFWVSEWPNTDFDNTSIESWVEVLDGGPPRDGIPAIDDPHFQLARDVTGLGEDEAVMVLELDGQPARAYPLRYLIWHEIVNDVAGGIPIAVTYCPLCNSAIVFDRRTDAGTLSFGVSGKLRNSDMLMYDRETESWWQQALGQGVVGAMNGAELETLPSWLEGWTSFASRNPDGLVMMQPTGFNRPYGRNPYTGYDTAFRPFLYSGELPPHDIDPLTRVVRVESNAWPLTRLRDAGEITENGITLSWQEGQASALDEERLSQGREVGNVRVFDEEGNNVVHDVMFAFAFHAFWPEGTWMLGN